MTKPTIITRYQLKGNQFYPNSTEKKCIFLHHTVGSSARSTLNWWNDTPEHVGCAFVIDKDGTIYQAFDPQKWGYQLGVKGATALEKASLGIELVSYGGLTKVGGNYYFRTSPKSPVGQVLIPEERVYKFPELHRGYEAFEKYTDQQVKSLKELLGYLIVTFKIDISNFDPNTFEIYNPHVVIKNLPGIWSHTTVRPDKSDIYPDPDLLKMLQDIKDQYFPVTKKITGKWDSKKSKS